MEPFLGFLGPVHGLVGAIAMAYDIGLEAFYPLFGCAKLKRQILGDVRGTLAAFICLVGHPLEQVQYGLSGAAQNMTLVRSCTPRHGNEWNDDIRVRTASIHRSRLHKHQAEAVGS